jgi:hypothetical protein
MKICTVMILFLSLKAFAYGNSDYEYLPFLDQNVKIGLGMSYSKLEANSNIGNFYLLSQANPRLEVSYSTPIKDYYRHRFFGSVVQELFRPENPTLVVKSKDARSSLYLSWQPIWLSEGKTFARHLRFAMKNSTVITQSPNVFTVEGDVGDRYSVEAGVGFTWYGLTVSKFPLGFDMEVLYSPTIASNATESVYNGLVYRMGIDFEFKKRSLFSGWGFRGFYEYEDIQNSYSHFVDKELGIVLNRAISF